MSRPPLRSEDPAGPSRARRVVGMCLSPVAGLAHLFVLDRYLRGTLLAGTFLVGWSLVAAGSLVWTGPNAVTMRYSGWIALAVSVVISVADATRWLVLTDHEKRRVRRDSAFRRGLAATVRGDAEEAVRSFREVVRLDPTLHAARYHLGVALLRARKPRAARRQLRRCVRWDPERAWTDEVRRAVLPGRSRRASRTDGNIPRRRAL